MVMDAMMARTKWAVTLGSVLLSFGCGTKDIELRTSLAQLPVTTPEPMAFEPPAAEPSIESPTGDDGEVVPRPSEALVIPANPLPDGFEPAPPPEPGCRKIDFLFVIDNSDSMEDEQANLARSFPGFIAVMEQVLEAKNFHIMVVPSGGDREEEDDPTLDPEDCAEVQGAGARTDGEGAACGITDGLPYMTDAQADLEATFSCVAQVGTDGSAIEEMMDSVLEATSPVLNASGRCNQGFLREDAVLVVTFVTDEEDRRSEGDPEEWRSALLAAKGGNEDALVVLGLVGDNNVDGGLLGGPCSGSDADGSPRLQSFVDSVDGVLGSVCAPDYTSFFQTAVGSIDSACADFVPPVIF
jgi:hypothetical protein